VKSTSSWSGVEWTREGMKYERGNELRRETRQVKKSFDC
jgi:hypothetical protein